MNLDRALATTEAGLIAWFARLARNHPGNRHVRPFPSGRGPALRHGQRDFSGHRPDQLRLRREHVPLPGHRLPQTRLSPGAAVHSQAGILHHQGACAHHGYHPNFRSGGEHPAREPAGPAGACCQGCGQEDGQVNPSCFRIKSQRVSLTSRWRGTGALRPLFGFMNRSWFAPWRKNTQPAASNSWTKRLRFTTRQPFPAGRPAPRRRHPPS